MARTGSSRSTGRCSRRCTAGRCRWTKNVVVRYAADSSASAKTKNAATRHCRSAAATRASTPATIGSTTPPAMIEPISDASVSVPCGGGRGSRRSARRPLAIPWLLQDDVRQEQAEQDREHGDREVREQQADEERPHRMSRRRRAGASAAARRARCPVHRERALSRSRGVSHDRTPWRGCLGARVVAVVDWRSSGFPIPVETCKVRNDRSCTYPLLVPTPLILDRRCAALAALAVRGRLGIRVARRSRPRRRRRRRARRARRSARTGGCDALLTRRLDRSVATGFLLTLAVAFVLAAGVVLGVLAYLVQVTPGAEPRRPVGRRVGLPPPHAVLVTRAERDHPARQHRDRGRARRSGRCLRLRSAAATGGAGRSSSSCLRAWS